MKEGPSFAPVAALAGDPARANMLAALMSGKALTASELAAEAGIAAPTASSHLAKLVEGGLVGVVAQGRHRYFRLAGPDVADMLEHLMGVAARAGHMRTRPGPSDPMIRKARICYDHLAGEMGVEMFDALLRARRLALAGDDAVRVTRKGQAFFAELGIDTGEAARRPLCRLCLDWSMRRSHLAGRLGAALLARMEDLGWASRAKGSRAVIFTRTGEARFARTFDVEL
ncbi:MAG TPA: winged helix-turn-helix domain-containing protein [Rhizomicrobium sp.]|nr:winged helix-turn-helix domain-containing protein [Rhizomicrobium sp.]